MKIYHNPRCSKSRQTLGLIEGKDKEVEVVRYLDNPPTKEELMQIVDMLGMIPEQLLRKGEAIYKENYRGKTFTDDEWLDIMCQHPKLIERPIVVSEGKAVLGRPPENVLKLF